MWTHGATLDSINGKWKMLARMALRELRSMGIDGEAYDACDSVTHNNPDGCEEGGYPKNDTNFRAAEQPFDSCCGQYIQDMISQKQ
jgi:hypothetical protein